MSQDMIPAAERKRVHDVLEAAFGAGEAAPLADVGNALKAAGVDRSAFGHKKLKEYLAALGPCVRLRTVVVNGGPQGTLEVLPWEGWMGDAPAGGAGEAGGAAASPGAADAPDAAGTGVPAGAGGPAPAGAPAAPLTGAPAAAPALLDPARAMERMAASADYRRAPVPDEVRSGLGEDLAAFVHLPAGRAEELRESIPPGMDPFALLEEDWPLACRAGALRYYEGKVVFPLHVARADGETPVEVSIRPLEGAGAGLKPWVLCYVNTYVRPKAAERPASPSRALEQFAWMGSWDQLLADLAELALPERWDFDEPGAPAGEGADGGAAPGGRQGRPPRPRHDILKNYLCMTFFRLKVEDKVLVEKSGPFAAFNTGLVTRSYDDIYACFEPNEKERPAWRFAGLCTAGGRGLGKRLAALFNPLPQPASYVQRLDDLLFDVDRPLIVDYEHILVDNIGRLPLDFLAEEMRGDERATRLVEQAARATDEHERERAFEELGRAVEADARLRNRLRNRAGDAVELARKRARWNYRTAVPCYYPRADSMSLLLPLCLVDDERVDAALVVQLMPSGNYQGQTVFTMRQAYMDARLICRPGNEWLGEPGGSF